MTKPNFKRISIAVLAVIFLIAAVIIIRDEIYYQFGYYDEYFEEGYADDYSEDDYYADDYSEQEYCSIMGLELFGDLTTYGVSVDEDSQEIITTSADNLLWSIDDMELDNRVKALILEIDSYGGSAVAAEEVANALKDATKPIVVVIRDIALSAAYWVATGADYIVASAMSEVGSIGVNASYLDNVEQNKAEGLTYNQLTSAKFKDAGDPNRKMTPEEMAIWERDLTIMHNYFVQQVATNRGLEVDKVKALADGATMMGQMALDNGLIDAIGSRKEAIQYLIDKNIISTKEGICWY